MNKEPAQAAGPDSHNKRFLSSAQAHWLSQQVEDLVPQAFHGVLRDDGVVLVEVACSPNSMLSEMVQQKAGYKGAAVRCSHWNGCDLGCGSGVKQVISTIDQLCPGNVWISPECGPYSPLQALNQRNPEQPAELEEKRRIALRQYVGASCIYQHCIQKGIHVTWEWSQRCQGWRLPFMQKLIQKYQPFIVDTHGCRVGLRDPKGHGLMNKAWRLMTTHKRLSEQMRLPCTCPKGYRHAKCEGGLAGATAYYTKQFRERVTKALFREMTHDMVTKEFHGHKHDHFPIGFGEESHQAPLTCGSCLGTQGNPVINPKKGDQGKPLVEPQGDRQGSAEHPKEPEGELVFVGRHLVKERDPKEIDRKLHLLHAATGHGSIKHMVQALKTRGAGEEVLARARQFRCAICEEGRKIQPKHVASLEPLPPKFATIEADGGHWYRPGTQEVYSFVVVIDEGSRYRVARIMMKGKHKTPNASQLVAYLRRVGSNTLGRPKP